MLRPALVLVPWLLGAAAAPWVIAPEEAAKHTHPIPTAERAASAQRGKVVFVKFCTTCHGEVGKGDGPTARALPQKVADLAHSAVQSQPDGAIFLKITQGRPPMMGYGRLISEKERWDLVSYIRSLAPPAKAAAP